MKGDSLGIEMTKAPSKKSAKKSAAKKSAAKKVPRKKSRTTGGTGPRKRAMRR
jgi:hypothetical protein